MDLLKTAKDVTSDRASRLSKSLPAISKLVKEDVPNDDSVKEDLSQIVEEVEVIKTIGTSVSTFPFPLFLVHIFQSLLANCPSKLLEVVTSEQLQHFWNVLRSIKPIQLMVSTVIGLLNRLKTAIFSSMLEQVIPVFAVLDHGKSMALKAVNLGQSTLNATPLMGTVGEAVSQAKEVQQLASRCGSSFVKQRCLQVVNNGSNKSEDIGTSAPDGKIKKTEAPVATN